MRDAPDNDAMRSDAWLADRLAELRETYFRDLPTGRPISVVFGRAARTRFGSIAAVREECRITVNGLFRHADLPGFIVDATLAHEMAHYAHGYGSGLPRLYAHPHHGGVVSAELASRGLADIEARAEAWRTANWRTFYEAHAEAAVERREARRDRAGDLWEAYLASPRFRTAGDLRGIAERVAARFDLAVPPFEVRWLHASVRQSGLSYYRSSERCVLVHGLLADPTAPQEAVVAQVAYWTAASVVGRGGDTGAALRRAGYLSDLSRANAWAARAWKRRLRTRHPLRTAPLG